MPPRKPAVPDANADQSTPPPGALEDQSEKLAAEQTDAGNKRGKRTRADEPTIGDTRPGAFRGTVIKLPTRFGKGKAAIGINGGFFNPADGQLFGEARNWAVYADGFSAEVAVKDIKEGEMVIGRGRWKEGREDVFHGHIDNEIDALEVFPTKDSPALAAGLGAEAAPSVADSGAAGGVGAGL